MVIEIFIFPEIVINWREKLFKIFKLEKQLTKFSFKYSLIIIVHILLHIRKIRCILFRAKALDGTP